MRARPPRDGGGLRPSIFLICIRHGLPWHAHVGEQNGGRRAFFLTFSITQRDLFRHDRRGATGLEVALVGEVSVDAAGEQRGRGGKISADQARAVCGMSGKSPDEGDA